LTFLEAAREVPSINLLACEPSRWSVAQRLSAVPMMRHAAERERVGLSPKRSFDGAGSYRVASLRSWS
jgi:hypothetical protein